MVAGYDDHFTSEAGTGALLIRNAWGAGWGRDGYGFLPYEFIRRSIAGQTWMVLRSPWCGQAEQLAA